MKRGILLILLVLGWIAGMGQQPATYTLLNGDSYTIGLQIDSSYDIGRLQQLELYVGQKKIGYIGSTPSINTAENHYFKFKLNSIMTKSLNGKNQVVVAIKDLAFGQRNYVVAWLDIIKTAGYSSSSAWNNAVDIQIDINPYIHGGLAGSSLLNTIIGKSAYEIALQNGFVGNEAAWLATFTVPKDSALVYQNRAFSYQNLAFGYKNEALGYKNTAGTSATTATTNATTATTQATNASNSASAASTSASTATTQATNASNSAASASASATNAATSASTATTQATNASNSASSASTSAANAATSASTATTQATNASNSASAASTSATNAATSATNALNSANTAASTLASKFTTPIGLTSGTLSKWNGTTYVNSLFSDNGTLATIAGDAVVNGITVGRGLFNDFRNTALGNSALKNSTSAIHNVAVGMYALNAATSGGYNTAVGSDALTANITGTSNVAIGYASLRLLSSGDNNTSINGGLNQLTSGSSNIGIGYSAGVYAADGTTTITSSYNSLFFGNYTKANASGQFNQIVVGYGAVGLGSNTSVLGNTLTTFGRWYGNLLLGSNTNSGEMLQVTGTSKLNGNVAITGNLSATGLNTITGTTASDTAPLGSELLSTSNWTSTGWTGDFMSGFTHTTGNTTTLSNTLVATIGTYYQIICTVTGRTAGNYSITFGGEFLSGLTVTSISGPKATTTGNLLISPSSDFDGTIVISIKVISNTAANFTFYNSSGGAVGQMRFGNDVNNVAFGYNTLKQRTTGAGLTALGNSALSLNTTGGQNTAIGVSALFSNTIGFYNIGIGNGTIQNNTKGNNNIGIGYNSLNQAVSANFNIGIGAQVLEQNITSGYNLGIGYTALRHLTSGSDNIAIGNSAGRYLTDGSTSHTNSFGSIFMGNGAFPLGDGQTNQIVIGNTARGKGDNSTTIGNVATTLTYLFGQVAGGSFKLHALNTAPASATATGIAGEIRMTATHIYVCTATNTWVRSALTTW